MKFNVVTGVIIFAATLFARAQSPSPSASPSASGSPSATPSVLNNIWRCDLPGGTYEVALPSIVSVSRHEYIVDGVARVVEANIDTQGNMAVRFYFIEPSAPKTPSGIGQSAIDRASELLKDAVQRGGQDDAWKRVVKTYPATTHTHTVEYRLKTEEDLKRIFESAQTAFETRRGSVFTLSE